MSTFSLQAMRDIKRKELLTVISNLEFISKRERKHYSLTLQDSQISIISEVKKSSPTAKLNLAADVKEQAKAYSEGGAVAISVLVDSNYFSGSYADLAKVAALVELPVLCKEFIYFKEQIELAYLCGADLVLLIAQSLSETELADLYNYTKSLGMSAIVEINTADEIDAVMKLDPEFVMVNMRNLNTLNIDIDEGIKVLNKIPETTSKISASGIHSVDDLQTIRKATKTNAFLIGSSLMKSGDPRSALKELCGVS